MRNAERALHAIRPPRTLARIKAYEHSQIAYWQRYIAVRAQYEPILVRHPALEVRFLCMEQWYVYTYKPGWPLVALVLRSDYLESRTP